MQKGLRNLMFCYIDLHIFLYILNTKKTVVIDYMLSVLELAPCADLKICANTGHLKFFFDDFHIHLHICFQQAFCYIQAITPDYIDCHFLLNLHNLHFY